MNLILPHQRGVAMCLFSWWMCSCPQYQQAQTSRCTVFAASFASLMLLRVQSLASPMVVGSPAPVSAGEVDRELRSKMESIRYQYGTSVKERNSSGLANTVLDKLMTKYVGF